MTFQEIQEKLKKCELALTSIKDGSYSNSKYTKEEALEKFNTIKESLEKKLNLLKETTVIDPTTPPSDAASIAKETGKKIQTVQTAIEKAKKGKEAVSIAEDDLSDEEQEEVTTETSHTEVVAKEVHKAFIDALQDTGHEVSDHNISSLNPETFTLTVKFKDNTQSDYSFEFEGNEVKLDGNILVTTNKKGVTPILNKTIAKDNSVKYLKSLSEELDPVGEEDDDINNDGKVDDTDKYLKKRRDAISKNIKEDESEPVVDKKGKYTGVRRLKLSDKDKETLKKIEDLLAKEKNETKGAPKGHYFTKSGNLVKGRLTKDARERGARLSDPKDKQRSKVPPVTQYNEAAGDNRHYIKVSRRDYKKAMSILDQNVDTTYVKIDPVDNDGAGNAIIYFIFRHEYGFDDMYDDPEGKDNPEFYQEPDEDPNAFLNDVVMDLGAHDIEVVDHSADMNEAIDINDPALMRARVAKMRADDMKKLDAYRKSPEGKAAARAQASAERKEEKARALVQKLKAKRAEIEREMENDPDIEPQGGPVADMYGDQLNKIDNAIEKAASVYNKPMDYDTAVGKVSEEDEFAGSDPKAGSTIKGRGFDWKKDDYGRTGLEPITFVDPEDLTPAAMANKKLNKEHIAVGHPDNEPGMLKQDAHDIAHYAVKLYKLLKYYDSLEDQVDFPHWWQSKVVKARECISKATHYLEFKTNEPAIDAQVGALQEGRSANAIKKEYDVLVKKMIELAKEYKQAEGDKKQKLVDQLKDHTKKKKELEKELDQAVQKTGSGQELDTSLNELSGDQRNDLIELQNILDDVAQKGEEAREIIRQSFPRMLSKADAYGAFDFGSSSNRYDTTLASIIEEIEEYYDEEEDLDEIGMFHDPIGYSSTAAAEDKRALQLVKDLINKGVNKEDAIEKAAEKFKLRVHYLTRYVNKSIDEAVTYDFEERIDQIVNHYFKGDQEVKKAAVEYASLKAARTMGGRSATASYFKDFFNNYSDEVANQAMEVIDMADDDVYQEGKVNENLTVVGHTPEEEKKNAEELVAVARKAGRDAKIAYDGDRIQGVDIGAPGLGTPEEVRAVQDRQFAEYDKNKPKDNKPLFKPKKLKKLKLGGKTYEIGDFDPNDDGRIMSIEKYPNGYFITGGIYTDYGDGDAPKEEYGYAIDLKGNEMEDYDLEGMYEGKYKSDAQRKAIYATKAEKGELKEEMDGGQLFDYFKSKGYDVKERSADGYPPKPGVEGYQVTRGSDRSPQSVIFQYNKDTDEFTISRMSGYRINQKDAIKAGMRQAGRSSVAGMDSYMTDGNWTPVDISAEGLKDIVDHVMGGLDREAKAQSDYYADRGRTSGTIDEGATCCGRCGRTHVKGSGCKRPYLKGKDHCRNN